MDELGTTDIEEFRLPNSGTIKLSQIKTEFNKGNNLTAYYGVVSGIPSSGIIKVTDFYGKEKPPQTSAPEGSYATRPAPQSPYYSFYIRETESSLSYDYYLAQVAGSGGGSYAPLPSLMAVGSKSSHADFRPPYYVTFPLGNIGWLDYYNQYRYIRIGPSASNNTAFDCQNRFGSWTSTVSGWELVCDIGNADAGQALYNLMSVNDQPIFVGLSNS